MEPTLNRGNLSNGWSGERGLLGVGKDGTRPREKKSGKKRGGDRRG